MNTTTYNALVSVLAVGVVVTLLLAVGYLIGAIAGWKGPHRKKRLVRFAILVAALPFFVIAQQLLLWRVFLPSLALAAAREHQMRIDAVSFVHTGDPAPAFTLTETSGRTFDLEDQRGKVVLVNFFATWCGSCRQELPHLQELWDNYGDDPNFALVVIGRDETNQSVSEFRSTHGFTFPMAADPQRSVYSLFAEELIPRTYLVSADGKIYFASTASTDPNMEQLKQELSNLLRSTR